MERLTVENGLSQGFVSDVLQTRSGFMWFATLDGLNRFDGVTFSVFHPEIERNTSAGDVRCLMEDSREFLWVLYDNDFGFLDQQSERFHFLSDRKIPPMTCLTEDAQGHLWGISTSRVLYRLSFPAGTRQPSDCLSGLQTDSFPLPPEAEAGRLQCLTALDTALWIGADNGIYALPYTGKNCHLVTGMPAVPVQGIWLDRTEKAVWLFSGSRILRCAAGRQNTFQLDAAPRSTVKQGISNGRVTCFLGGRYIFEWRDGTLHRLPWEIPEGIISGCMDRRGLLWVGTDAQGARKIPIDHFFFDRFGKGISMSRQPVYDAQGQVWLSAGRTGLPDFRRYDPVTGGLQETFVPGTNAYYLLRSRAGQYWFVAQEGELCQVDRPGGRPECHRLPYDGGYSDLLEDQKNRILVASGWGEMLRWDPATNRLTEHSFAELFKGRVLPWLQALAEDALGRIWIGTTAGLLLAVPDGGNDGYRFQLYNTASPAPGCLSDNQVLALLPDPADPAVCWVGTRHGLNRLDTRNGECRQFTAAGQGLPNDVICSILPEDGPHIWLGTYFGLLEFDTRTYTWRHFTKADGLPCNEFNHRAALRLPDGRLFFGGVDGFTVFHPADTRGNSAPLPRLCLTGLYVGAQKVNPGDASGILPAALPFVKSVTLRHDQDNLSFSFALLDYFRVAGNRYAYRLRGLHEDWQNSGTVNQAVYYSLTPGNYVFEVMAWNSAGLPVAPVSVSVTILKPWWLTGWAYALYALALLGAFGGGFWIWRDRMRMNHRLHLERRQIEHFRELERFKSRLFANFTHEFRTPLAIIRGLSDELRRIAGKPETQKLAADIRQQTDDLLSLTDRILDLAKLEEQKLPLYPEPVNLTGFLAELCQGYRVLAAEKKITCLCRLPVEPVWVEADVARLRDLLANLVTNAVKFTPEGGSISLAVEQPAAGELRITVSDTGIGIAPADQEKIFERFYQVQSGEWQASGAGIGLAYAAELTRAMGGRISVNSRPGLGSDFILTLPVISAPVEPAGRPAIALPADETRPQNTRPVLLIVEDNVAIARLLAGYVSDLYIVSFAANGRAGLEKAVRQVPDLVLCDLRMPEMNGLEFCRALRTNLQTSHIPVIVLTAYTDESDRLEALRAGASLCLTKPVGADILRQQIHNLLQMRREMQVQVMQNYGAGTSPGQPNALPEKEKSFMQQIMDIIAREYHRSTFTVTDIQRTLNLSKSQLHRKLVSVSGFSANHFIRKYRLNESKKILLAHPDMTVAEVAYKVGFSDPNYFSRAFSIEYGKTPSAFRQQSE